MQIAVCVFLVLIGAAMGSFVGALTWRMKRGMNFVSGRSECEKCHHVLGVSDLIPIISWLALRGKCRYCRHKIGWLAPALEIGTATLFVISYLFWPLGALDGTWQIVLFVLWLFLVVGFAALAVYDARWYLLPNKIIFPMMGVAAVFWAVNNVAVAQFEPKMLIELIYSMLPITGFYGLMYLISRGKWIGLGDVKFGVIVGLLLSWQSGVLVLILANVLGSLLLVPLVAARKVKRDSKIPFGPMLIAAVFTIFLFSQTIVEFVGRELFLL